MAVRTIIGCDSCGAEPADTLTLDIGGGPRRVDLCAACQDVVGLAKLQALLNDFGADVESTQRARSPEDDEWFCPVCQGQRASRRVLLDHMTRMHGMSLVEASRAVPPLGLTISCEVCGYLTNPGPGYAQHVTNGHSPEAWAKIKARAQQ